MEAVAGPRASAFLQVHSKRVGRIQGECGAQGHEGEIDLIAWDWGVSASSALGALGAAERRAYRHLVVRKHVDAASTALLKALVLNDEVREAVLTLRKAGGEALDYFRMKLGGARIVAVDIDFDAQGMPLERVALAFTQIEIEYWRQDGTGQGSSPGAFNDEVLGG